MSYPVLSGFSTGRFGSAFDTTVRIPYIPQKRVSHIILLETENPAPRIPWMPPSFETLEIGKFENWEEPLHGIHGLFFIGKMMIIHWVCILLLRETHWGILRPEDAEMACSYTYCISLSCQGELQVLNQLQVPVLEMERYVS